RVGALDAAVRAQPDLRALVRAAPRAIAHRRGGLMRGLLGSLLLLALLAPIAFLLWVSFVNTGEGASALTLERYRSLFVEAHFARALLGSSVIAAGATLLALSLASPAAYAIARLRFSGARLLLAGALVLGVLPQISLLPSLYAMFRSAGLLDSRLGLVLA